jgi:hypothetical protein
MRLRIKQDVKVWLERRHSLLPFETNSESKRYSSIKASGVLGTAHIYGTENFG